MLGIWYGFYQYKSKTARKIAGFEKTNFTLTIDFFDGQHFSGVAQDDLKSGGMNESGKIVGQIDGNVIRFTKHMPKQQRIIDSSGTRQTFNKPHPILYYSGSIDKDKHQAEGKWKFGFRIVFLFSIIPIPMRLGKGYWYMKLSDT